MNVYFVTCLIETPICFCISCESLEVCVEILAKNFKTELTKEDFNQTRDFTWNSLDNTISIVELDTEVRSVLKSEFTYNE